MYPARAPSSHFLPAAVEQRDAAAVKDTGQYVLTEIVGPEGVRSAAAG